MKNLDARAAASNPHRFRLPRFEHLFELGLRLRDISGVNEHAQAQGRELLRVVLFPGAYTRTLFGST